MAHTHPVKDSDKHFVIDPVTRAIENAQHKKTKLMQHDHNSEEFTFEIPQIIEGHDLSKCNRIQIHYCNTDALSRATSLGVYEVREFLAHDSIPSYGGGEQATDYVMEFSWLISKNATKYAGPLGFAIVFTCVENGEEVYRWSTDINTSISIATSMANEVDILESYPDVFVQMKEELRAAVFGYKVMGSGPVEPTTGSYMWLNTSVFETEEIKSYVEQQGDVTEHAGIIVVRGEDGAKKVLYPVTKLEAVEDADEILNDIRNLAKDAKDTAENTNTAASTAQSAATAAQNAANSASNAATAAQNAATSAGTTAGNALAVANGALKVLGRSDFDTTNLLEIFNSMPNNSVFYGDSSYYYDVAENNLPTKFGTIVIFSLNQYRKFMTLTGGVYNSSLENNGMHYMASIDASGVLTWDLAYTKKYKPTPNEIGAIPIVSGATEGTLPAFDASGKLAATTTKAAKVITSDNFVLDGTTLIITTP